MHISGVVQTYSSPVNLELYLLDRAVPRALTPFRHSLGAQLSEDYVLTSYADTLLKIYKINEMDFFFLWGHDALFSSRREILNPSILKSQKDISLCYWFKNLGSRKSDTNIKHFIFSTAS